MIRPATPDDLPSMVETYNQAIADKVFANCDVPHDSIEKFRLTYFGKDRRFAVLVYLSRDGDTVAWGALKPFSARPDDETMAEVAVYVRRDMRARGVGIRLLQALEVSAREAGFESLVAIILGPNHASARGCKSQGFAECVRIPRIARLENNLVDIVWLQKKMEGNAHGFDR
ncbi:GNAT family N-acetyltransferase [Pseudomonas mediterranea]|uniref:GNAT family N-acetyltransferase n=1 Tax=Pseudomonas mediterranea TaxID=183795 RepID=UPI003BF4EA26